MRYIVLDKDTTELLGEIILNGDTISKGDCIELLVDDVHTFFRVQEKVYTQRAEEEDESSWAPHVLLYCWKIRQNRKGKDGDESSD